MTNAGAPEVSARFELGVALAVKRRFEARLIELGDRTDPAARADAEALAKLLPVCEQEIAVLLRRAFLEDLAARAAGVA